MINFDNTSKHFSRMTDYQLLDFLCKYWDLDREKPLVYGILTKGGLTIDNLRKWVIVEVRNISGKRLDYPPEVGINKFEIFISNYSLDEKLPSGNYVEIEIELSSLKERSRQKNPCSLRAKGKSYVALINIPQAFVSKDASGGIFLNKSIYDQISNNLDDSSTSKKTYIAQLEQEILGLEKHKEEYQIYKSSVEKFIIEKTSYEETLQKLESSIKDAQIKFSVTLEQEKDVAFQATQNQVQVDYLQAAIDKLATKNKLLSEEEIILEQKIKSLKREEEVWRQIVEEEMNKTEQLRRAVRAHADRLHNLEFIDDDQYNDIIDNPKDREKPDGEELLFDGPQLAGDFKKLAKYLQVYLFEQKEIMYPLYLLKDFITLLRTQDFIILSGLSGAGKTLLVKAMAVALGGVAKIVPVKPNWTSSEDLLGYYNPLQKAYLSTPFLDALVEAKHNPQQLYLICLDEMNLARVEYYFADFLSALEEREKVPEIKLYSEEENGNVLAEFKLLLAVLDDVLGTSGQPLTFGELLTNRELNQKLQERMGKNDSESLAQLYARLQRMVSQLLNIPATLEVPANVRIIGAINVDQTTNSLSPKVIDRAHIIQFQSPFKYTDKIEEEVEQCQEELGFPDYTRSVYLQPEMLEKRKDYPSLSNYRNDQFVRTLVTWITNHFEPLGIDVGLRTIRQALNYRELATNMGDDEIDVLNSLLLYKILPRFSFEGNTEVKISEEALSKHERVQRFNDQLKDKLRELEIPAEVLPRPRSYEKLDELWQKADSSDDKLYNYWS